MGAKKIKENTDLIDDQPKKRNKKKKYRIRMFPIWLRIIVVVILAFGAIALGLMVGYGVLGEGEATQIFDKETWQHVIDIVKKEK